MKRRDFITSIFGLIFFSGKANAQQDPLRGAFEGTSPAARRSCQEQLSMGDFYSCRMYGTYWPNTRSALLNAASFITDNSYGRVTFDLKTAAGSSAFVNAIARGEMAKYLWGEGDEADEGQ